MKKKTGSKLFEGERHLVNIKASLTLFQDSNSDCCGCVSAHVIVICHASRI